MPSVKQVFVGMFALAVAGTAIAATPATPEHSQTHKDQVFFQGKWRHVHWSHEVSVPLKPNQTIGQVEKLAKEISSDRVGDQPPRLFQIQGKDWLIWDDPFTR
jgi:methionyl-tRNA synthetase